MLVLSKIVFFHCSGKTIPNGTDKNQQITPENEGKLIFIFIFLVVGLPLLGNLSTFKVLLNPA